MPREPIISRKERTAFIRDVRALLKKHEKFAGQVALAEIPPEPPDREKETPILHLGISRTRAKRCVAYGVDPITGRRVCVQWAEVS